MTLDESPVESTKAAHRRKAPRVSADPLSLRGASGEAALNPGGRLREQSASPTVPGELALRVQTRRRARSVQLTRRLRQAAVSRRPAKAGRSGGSRARPPSRKSLSRRPLSREGGSCGGIAPPGAWLRPGSSASGVGFRPASRRLRDRRCSSGSSRGEAPSAGAGQHGVRRRVARGPHRLLATPMEEVEGESRPSPGSRALG